MKKLTGSIVLLLIYSLFLTACPSRLNIEKAKQLEDLKLIIRYKKELK